MMFGEYLQKQRVLAVGGRQAEVDGGAQSFGFFLNLGGSKPKPGHAKRFIPNGGRTGHSVSSFWNSGVPSRLTERLERTDFLTGSPNPS